MFSAFSFNIEFSLLNQKKKEMPTTAGFEPARAEPKRFLILRLNHSAKLPEFLKLKIMHHPDSELRSYISVAILPQEQDM